MAFSGSKRDDASGLVQHGVGMEGDENGAGRSYSPVSVNSTIYNHAMQASSLDQQQISSQHAVKTMHETDLFNRLWGQRVWRVTYLQLVSHPFASVLRSEAIDS